MREQGAEVDYSSKELRSAETTCHSGSAKKNDGLAFFEENSTLIKKSGVSEWVSVNQRRKPT